MASNFDFPVATASISWVDPVGTTHWRVYSTDSVTVTEWARDGSGDWGLTGFTAKGLQVSANVHLYNGGAYIRVYCTTAEQTLEWCQDDGGAWYQGDYMVPPASPA